MHARFPLRLALWAGLASLGVGLPAAPCVQADPPRAPAPGPPEDRAAALARAEELARGAAALAREKRHEEAVGLLSEALALRERFVGPDSLAVASTLHDLGVLLRAQGDPAKARPTLERAVVLREKLHPPFHPETLASLDALIALLDEQLAYDEATPWIERALAIREVVLGANHDSVALALNSLGNHHHRHRDYAKARAFYERSVRTFEGAHGLESPLLIQGLRNLALAYEAEGRADEGLATLRRALQVSERAHGPSHLEVATSLLALGNALRARSALAEARPHLERALALREQAFGGSHLEVALARNDLAILLQDLGLVAEALPLFESALAIRSASLPADHPYVAHSLSNLGYCLEALGRFPEARALHERAVAMREARQGPDHIDLAPSLNNLGVVLYRQGDFAGARTLHERALVIRERSLGPLHPDVASSLVNLASLHLAVGAYEEARPLLERALFVCEQARGKRHPDVALCLTNLAWVHRNRGDLGQAKEMQERALSMLVEALGPDHPTVASCLMGLAGVLGEQGARAEALSCCERALAIRERALGPAHPAVADCVDGMSFHLAAQGLHSQARRLSERALGTLERALGATHPRIVRCLNNLAEIQAVEGSLAEAESGYRRALGMLLAQVRAQLVGLNGRQRILWLRTSRYLLGNWLRFAPRVQSTGYPEVLSMRGIVQRVEGAERALARRAGPDHSADQAALHLAQRLVAKLAQDVPPAVSAERWAAWQRRYAEAAADLERQTLDLSRRSEGVRGSVEARDLTQEHVQARIGRNRALVDLLRVGDRYLAWVVLESGDPLRIDLGAADAVEDACRMFLRAIEREGRDPTASEARVEMGSNLRRMVWDPIAARLGAHVERVVIVPDAALADVPFEALPGRVPTAFLLDDLSLSYVMHALDLVPGPGGSSSGQGALVVGAVDYERSEGRLGGEEDGRRPEALVRADRAPRRARYRPLPETRAEAVGLVERLGRDTTMLLLGAEATEAAFRASCPGKRYVHVATHGFAHDDLMAGLYERKVGAAWLSADVERQLAAGHDPLLLSGLTLAGANPREGANGDDGILTALEASYLDLDGVDLVTLSACETARGTAESGEGVLGLVSAFQMAGARNVVASLWKVDDEATRLLMDGFYERLLRKEHPLSPSGALREAALALRDRQEPDGTRRFAAPRYWAAFVAYGR